MASTAAASASATATGFLASTQAQHWLWHTREQIRAVRTRAQAKPARRIRITQRANEAAAAAAATASSAAAAADVTMSPVAKAASADSAQPMQLASPAAPAAVAAAAAKSKKAAAAGPLEPLSMEEERLLRLHYTIQLQSMSSILALPSAVMHTAIIYFKRFFLHESVMEYSPKDVAYCCIYLACKTEEYSLPVDRMVSGILAAAAAAPAAASATSAAPPAPALNPAVASTVSTVLSLEVPVLSTLQFHLRLHHLSRALRGLIKELETFDTNSMSRALWINPAEPAMTQYTNAKGPGTEYTTLVGFFSQLSPGSRASVLLSHALLEDDLIFLHSPSQIALAVLATLEHEARSFAVEPKLDSTAHAASTPLASLNLVARYIDSLKPPRAAAAGTAAAAASAAAPSNKQLQAKVDEIRQMMETARVQSISIDKKLLKAIEKKRKAVSNPLLDPSSKSYHESKERASLEKDAKRAAKKKKQRDEEQRKQDDLLGMSSAGLMQSPDRGAKDPLLASDSGGSGGFMISRKKLKSEPSTPAAATAGATAKLTLDREGDLAMMGSPAPAASRIARKGSNLAAQFSEVQGMEQE